MNIAIVGFGDQGQSAYQYWQSGQNQLTICDQNTNLAIPENATPKLGPKYLNDLDEFDLVVRSPSVHPNDIARANGQSVLGKVTTNTNQFFKVCPTQNIIGVTGTKGKGTTSTLIARMLEASGQRVHLGGNIGIPPLDLLKNDIRPTDWVILELANFQLIDIKYSPSIAVCLMIEPEHLDWHTNEEEYMQAKQQLFRWQDTQKIAVYFEKNPSSKQIAATGKGKKIPYFQAPGAEVKNNAVCIDDQVICATDEIKLPGNHNLENICAAITVVWQITQDIPAIKKVLLDFSGLEHRLELVRELDGVRYYNDSFATTPESTIAAIKSFSEPKIMILGGSDKGSDYTKLAETIANINNNVKHVVLMGATAPAIKKALATNQFSEITEAQNNIQSIVLTARKVAKRGDVVMLSPACASFGLFENYKDRGEQFKNTVLKLSH